MDNVSREWSQICDRNLINIKDVIFPRICGFPSFWDKKYDSCELNKFTEKIFYGQRGVFGIDGKLFKNAREWHLIQADVLNTSFSNVHIVLFLLDVFW